MNILCITERTSAMMIAIASWTFLGLRTTKQLGKWKSKDNPEYVPDRKRKSKPKYQEAFNKNAVMLGDY